MKVLKTLTLVLSAGLLMANKECQQTPVEQATTARELKRFVDVGRISSRPIEVPGNGSFDFQYVVSQQIYPVLDDTQKFQITNGSGYTTPASESFNLNGVTLTKNDYQMLSNSFQTNKVVFSNDVSCLLNLPQFSIHGSVNSFEMMGGGGLNIGFVNGANATTGAIPKVGFNLEIFQLDLNLTAVSPFNNKIITSVNVTSKQTRTNINLYIPFQSLLFEPSFFFQTPLARVTYDALSKAIKQISLNINELEKKEAAVKWSTRVLYPHEEQIAILGGRLNNIRKGDTFDIYSEGIYWEDANNQQGVPCESKLISSNIGEKIATVEVMDDLNISDTSTLTQIIWKNPKDIPIQSGALVKVNKLYEPPVSSSTTGNSSTSNSSNKK